MLHQKITIINKLGLHARASAKLVNLASRFASESQLIKDGQKVNAKSIMGMMLLAAKKGTELELVVSGEDEEAAMAAIVELINNRFGEEE
jgi:phosphocarrier protein